MGPIPAAILLGSLAIAYFYPITRSRHARIVRVLDKRKARERAIALQSA
jgi:Na+/melibiose symporter-like transporter